MLTETRRLHADYGKLREENAILKAWNRSLVHANLNLCDEIKRVSVQLHMTPLTDEILGRIDAAQQLALENLQAENAALRDKLANLRAENLCKRSADEDCHRSA